MPNRLIREGWLDSERVNALSPTAERFFLRLMLVSDDAGRFDGRTEILRARLFPLKDGLSGDDLKQSLHECASQGLLMAYEWDGKPFIQLAKIQRSSPAATSKFPWSDGSFKIEYIERETRDGKKEFVTSSLADGMRKPSEPIAGLQRAASRISGDGDGDGDGDGLSGRETKRMSNDNDKAADDNDNDFAAFWELYPRKRAKGDAEKAWATMKAARFAPRIMATLALLVESDEWKKDGGQWVPGAGKWLRAKGWEDQVTSPARTRAQGMDVDL